MRSMQGVRKNRLVVVGGLLLVLVCAAAMQPHARPGAPPATLAALVTLTGAHSHIAEARCLRITTQAEWAALWLEHLGEPPKADYSLYSNKAGLPVVDFERCMVIVVLSGSVTNVASLVAVNAPAAGEGEADGAAAVFRFASNSYQTGGTGPDGGAVSVTPFGFFVVPRTLEPLVVQQLQRSMGGPAQDRVVEQARFPELPPVQPAAAPEPTNHR